MEQQIVDIDITTPSLSSEELNREQRLVRSGIDIILDRFIPGHLISPGSFFGVIKKDDVLVGTYGIISRKNQYYRVMRAYNGVNKSIKIMHLDSGKEYRIANDGFRQDGSIHAMPVDKTEQPIVLWKFKGIFRHLNDYSHRDVKLVNTVPEKTSTRYVGSSGSEGLIQVDTEIPNK